MTPNSGACWVKHPGTVEADTLLTIREEHARLKDHVSSMEGQLEARVHEGGMWHLIRSLQRGA